jgi:hypothetical protein
MAVLNDPNTAANIAQVGPVTTAGGTQNQLHTLQYPLPHGSLGHYRTAVKLTMAVSQAANSRLFELRNTHATNLIIPTRIRVIGAASGTVTTGYLGEIGVWRLTAFTAVDTTNTVTPTSSVKRTDGMAAYPGGAAVRHVTVAGAAAGMTGGTLTKDGNQVGSALFVASTLAANSTVALAELLDDVNGTHPLVFKQNEGFEIENVVVGSATANAVQISIDVCWAEVTAF